MTDGTWWDHWADWLIARAGEERPRPQDPGSRRHRVLGPARRGSTCSRRFEVESVRVDQWLWAVRLFKTRSESTEACRAGHVRVNGAPVKPAAKVHVGDRVTARAHQRERILEVVALINKRVSAPLAAECLVDHSPPPPPKHEWMPVFRRDPGTGRPTKRDRRRLDELRSG
jgi:ribosomal 50S subunit-recycling heat shock protein